MPRRPPPSRTPVSETAKPDSGAQPLVRVDAWVWAVRLMPTRTASSNACDTGKVRLNGAPTKSAKKIGVGDEIEVRNPAGIVKVKVTRTITKRVGAVIAAECYEVLSRESTHQSRPPGEAVWAQRDRGTGRPTKRDRRQMDRMRGDR